MNIVVVGLGYVGLPLAVELAKVYRVVGFDINNANINLLKSNRDPNSQVGEKELELSCLSFSDDPSVISVADLVIVTVPTPVDENKVPDLTPLSKASQTIALHMKKGVTICYESTVFPGTTEDVCVPVLEKYSMMEWKKDFHVGYSPERINPGDKVNTLSNIVKVVSGDTGATLDLLSEVYGKVVKAGIYRAESIKVAEAAKVIENTQRDINIAIMNEFRVIFDKMGISTKSVLDAAATKWNFLNFKPGLVGGHCIGVDPYYLATISERLGHYPGLIRAARRLNDSMSQYFSDEIIRKMIDSEISIKRSDVLLLGITFKENVSDIRNSRVVDIYRNLKKFGINVDVVDPIADGVAVLEEYGIELLKTVPAKKYDFIVLAVPHTCFIEIGKSGLERFLKPDKGMIYDIKEIL